MKRVVALAILVVACGRAPSPVHDPQHASLDDATADHVAGSIDGSAFEALDVRFRVFARGAEQHVDLWIADAPIERCGLALARTGTRVWLRWPGRTSIEPGTFEQDDPPSIEAHYERAGDRHFVQAHRASAVVEITRVAGDAIEGRMRACFGDAHESCVGGRFVASPCLSRVDGRAIREPPGLADEALEPRSRP